VVQQWEVPLEFSGHGCVYCVFRIAQVLGCLLVVGVDGEPELFGNFLVLFDFREERLSFPVEVLYFVLDFLEVNVDPLDNLYLYQLFELVVRVRAD